MLVTFSSESAGKIMFFGDVAKRLLELMGQTGVIPGAIKAEDVPQALSLLQESIAKIKASTPQNHSHEISLAQRAVPLMDLLKTAIKYDDSVMWR